MTRLVRTFVLSAVLAGPLACVDSPDTAASTGAPGSSASSGSGSGSVASTTSVGSTGSTTGAAGTSGGSGTTSAVSTSAGAGSTGASGGSSAGGTTTGGGTSNGGTTTGGSTSGGAVTLAQACTDYIAGRNAVQVCESAGSFPLTVEECEAALAVCTSGDDQIIDQMSLCLVNLACDPDFLTYENEVIACFSLASNLSIPCQDVGQSSPDAGPQDPDAGLPDGDAGMSTTTGGRGP